MDKNARYIKKCRIVKKACIQEIKQVRRIITSSCNTQVIASSSIDDHGKCFLNEIKVIKFWDVYKRSTFLQKTKFMMK